MNLFSKNSMKALGWGLCKLRVFLLVLLVLMTVSGLPQPAHADCCANKATETTSVMSWIEDKLQLIGIYAIDAELISGFAMVVSWFIILKEIIMGGFDGVNAVVTGSFAALGDMMAKMAQAEVDYDAKFRKADFDAQIARQKAMTKAGNDVLCVGTQAVQNWQLAGVFKDAVAGALTASTYCFGDFCPKCIGPKGGTATASGASNCNAVVAAAEMAKMVCAAKGADPNEISASKNSCKMDGLAGAARNPAVIWGDLQFVKSGEKPKGIAGYRFMNAMAYCYMIGGAAPQRPIKEQAETPQGAAAAASFDQCKAQRDGLMHQCLEIVARHTRAPGTGSGSSVFDEIVKRQNAFCENARDQGADVSRLDNCKSGISFEQARWLAVSKCATTQNYVGQASMTTTEQKDLNDSIQRCIALKEAYESNVLREKQEFRGDVEKLSLLPGCGGS